jgi:hypothetical protein
VRTLFSHAVGAAPVELFGEPKHLRTDEGVAPVERAGGSGVVLSRVDDRVAFLTGAHRAEGAPA